MLPEDWDSGFGRTIGVFLNGHGIQGQDSRGRRITDDSFLLCFNAHDDDVDFTLPAEEFSPFWDMVIDTAGPGRHRGTASRPVGAEAGRASPWWCSAPTPAPRWRWTTPQRRRWPRWPHDGAGAGGAPAGGEQGARTAAASEPTAPSSAAGRGPRSRLKAEGQTGRMRTPVSTYRLQIRPGFTLQDAAETVPYLKSLGVDWVYLSPILTAEKGSDHGYDVTDPSAGRPGPRRPGGPAGRVARRRGTPGMGVLVDIVPNHVGVATPSQNPWWWALLKEGQQSRYAQAFDVDWDFGGGRIRMPVLGSRLRRGRAGNQDGELRYYDHRFPLAEGSYAEGG